MIDYMRPGGCCDICGDRLHPEGIVSRGDKGVVGKWSCLCGHFYMELHARFCGCLDCIQGVYPAHIVGSGDLLCQVGK